jgi:lipid A 3-O-deacylase
MTHRALVPRALMLAFAFSFGLAASPASAEDLPDFRAGLQEWGVSAGYGFPIPFAFEDRTEVPFGTIVPRYGRWVSGRSELMAEFPVAVFDRDSAVLAGFTLMYRHHVGQWGRIRPFLDVGTGVTWTNLEIRELGGELQFLTQGGGGVRYFLNAEESIEVAMRYYHLSNAGIRSPNTGYNSNVVMVGYSRFF